jgi:hypothetical protein
MSARNAWLAGDQTTDNWNTSGLLIWALTELLELGQLSGLYCGLRRQ